MKPLYKGKLRFLDPKTAVYLISHNREFKLLTVVNLSELFIRMFINRMENLLKYGKTQGLLEGKDMENNFCRYSVGIYNKVIGLTCFKPSAARIENIQTLKKASAVRFI